MRRIATLLLSWICLSLTHSNAQTVEVFAGGNAPPEFLSTHPSNDTRIANLAQWAPLARQEAQKFGVTSFQ